MAFGTVGPPITPLNPQNRQDKRSPFHTSFWPQKSEVKESKPSEVVATIQRSKSQNHRKLRVFGGSKWHVSSICTRRSISGALRAEPPVLARPTAAQGPTSAAQKCRPSPQWVDEERDYISIYLEIGCHMGMDQYLLISFLVGWTSIYQLFWCSPGVQGFDTLPYGVIPINFLLSVPETSEFLAAPR